LLDTDLAYIVFQPNTLLELDDFKESLATYHKLADGKRLKMLVEFGEHTNATAEGRVFSQENNPNGIAEALVIRNLAQRILANFYITFHKQDHPIKIFNNKDLALKWLQSI